MKTYKIEITPKSILILLGILICTFILWRIKLVIFLFFISFIIASSLRPLVEILHRRGMPRFISISIIYTAFMLLLGILLYISGIALASQVETLLNNTGTIFSDIILRLFNIFPWLKDVFHIKDISNIKSEVQLFVNMNLETFFKGTLITRTTGEAVISTISNIMGLFIGVFTVLIISAYMIVSEDKFYEGILQVFSKSHRQSINVIIDKVEEKLGKWLIGEFILMFAVGFATYIVLMIPSIFFPINVFSQYAIPIALIAGLLEVVPNIGPTLTWVLVVIITIGSGGSAIEVLYISVASLLIQQAEAAFLVPVVMKKAVGIDPVIIILSFIAASTLFGMVGAILVIPIVATGQIIIEEIVKSNTV